jgi:hypothetical protein
MKSLLILDRQLKDLPDFETTLSALVRLPSERQPEFVFSIYDEHNDITYRIRSRRAMEPREMRQAIIRALRKTGEENKRSVTYEFDLETL